MQIELCDDGVKRCGWCVSTEEYIAYHDNEWGHPVGDDRVLFEKICLEGFQSGLSWRTILVKRDNFRVAFKDFDFYQLAEFTGDDVERLLLDAGIVRHRGKIEAVINNAKRACEMVEIEGSLSAFFWSYAPRSFESGDDIPSKTSESNAMAKELKKRGWRFVGPTTVYAFMQAAGMVNDHAKDCAFYDITEQKRLEFLNNL